MAYIPYPFSEALTVDTNVDVTFILKYFLYFVVLRALVFYKHCIFFFVRQMSSGTDIGIVNVAILINKMSVFNDIFLNYISLVIRPPCRHVFIWYGAGVCLSVLMSVCLSVRLSAKHIKTIQTEPFLLGPSNLVHILLMTRERTLLILNVTG